MYLNLKTKINECSFCFTVTSFCFGKNTKLSIIDTTYNAKTEF